MKILYSTCPAWQAGKDSIQELKEAQRLETEQRSSGSFNEIYESIVNSGPAYVVPSVPLSDNNTGLPVNSS